MNDIDRIRARFDHNSLVIPGTSRYEDVKALLAAIDERDAELFRLRAQVASIGSGRTWRSPKESWPDDTDWDESIAEAERFSEAAFAIAEKYGAAITNDEERWQDGEFLRDVCDFQNDVQAAAERFLVRPAVDERDKRITELEAKWMKCVDCGQSFQDALDTAKELADARARITELELTAAQMGLTISTWHERLAAIRKVLERSQTGLTYIRDIYAAINGEVTDA